MATIHEVPKKQSLVTRILTTDFCPWANRFVYWLKEPIGWFVVATAISCMVGLYFSPIGWTLAASLIGIIVVGMVWPLVAVYAAQFQLSPEAESVHEDDSCRMMVGVRNRIPFPVWGLVVEGYLEGGPERDDDAESPLPTVGLASVPPMCHANYGLNIQPSLRGRYPRNLPKIACSFPFGIWTARRNIQEVATLTVWPKIYSTEGLATFSAKVAADFGSGSRNGRDGDINGVRDYRRGDSVKHIHWVASARMDSLMITQRSAPQSAEVEVRLDTSLGSGGPEELSRRIRIAASIVASLRQQNLPMRVQVGDHSLLIPKGNSAKSKIAFQMILDEMAMIPIQGVDCSEVRTSSSSASITVSGTDHGSQVVVINPSASRRAGNGVDQWLVDVEQDLDSAMQHFWRKVGHAEPIA